MWLRLCCEVSGVVVQCKATGEGQRSSFSSIINLDYLGAFKCGCLYDWLFTLVLADALNELLLAFRSWNRICWWCRWKKRQPEICFASGNSYTAIILVTTPDANNTEYRELYYWKTSLTISPARQSPDHYFIIIHWWKRLLILPGKLLSIVT